ncbi:regulator of volume decrease after cellular swelling-domain-containing protein [Dichotomocladium elegans]|nr:regulator of volume decrease after cellular swelling-domain-containing protein [Dichotomocladium elegans]
MTVTLLSSPPDLAGLVIKHAQKDTDLEVLPPLANVHGAIKGDLYVCESQVYFYSAESQSGIAVEYPDIIIHAISRQDGRPSIYCQLEQGRFFPGQQIPKDEDILDIVTELRFMPQDAGALEGIYAAFSECAALHPDEEFMAEQEALENENEYFADPSDEAELNEVQQAALRHLESVFQPPMNGRKEDEDHSMDEEQ